MLFLKLLDIFIISDLSPNSLSNESSYSRRLNVFDTHVVDN